MTEQNNEMPSRTHFVPTKFYIVAWVISLFLGLGAWFSAGYFVAVMKKSELMWISLGGFILSLVLMAILRWKIDQRSSK